MCIETNSKRIYCLFMQELGNRGSEPSFRFFIVVLTLESIENNTKFYLYLTISNKTFLIFSHSRIDFLFKNFFDFSIQFWFSSNNKLFLTDSNKIFNIFPTSRIHRESDIQYNYLETRSRNESTRDSCRTRKAHNSAHTYDKHRISVAASTTKPPITDHYPGTIR